MNTEKKHKKKRKNNSNSYCLPTSVLKKYQFQMQNEKYGNKDKVTSGENVDDKIKEMNMEIRQREEEQKVRLRETLTRLVARFILLQLGVFNFVIVFIVAAVVTNFSFFRILEHKIIQSLFDLLKYYISATIVELLGMLVFILHYVFSKYSGIDHISDLKDILKKKG